MDRTTLHRMIYRRKSVRKFQSYSLPDETCQWIRQQTEALVPLMPDLTTEVRLMSGRAVRGLLAIPAPHYLLCFSEPGNNDLENIGFMLQQMDLTLSAAGLGTCWLGVAKPTASLDGVTDLPFVIAMAVGEPAEALHRENRTEFKRKPANALLSGQDHTDLVEAARLAPSATNSQPWRFRTEPGAVHVYRKKPWLLSAYFYERMNRIDMGIALCHLWIAALEKSEQVRLQWVEEAARQAPAGTTYTMTLSVGKQT